MGAGERREKKLKSVGENANKDKEKINIIKKEAKIEGGFTWYLTAFTFLLIGILFQTKLSGIGVIIFIIIGAMKSYESHLYGQFIYYSFINNDKKISKEYQDKLKSYPNSSKILENIRVANK